MPSNPAKIIQKVAPGPPKLTAIATPAIFPNPTVAAVAVHRACLCDTSPGAFFSDLFEVKKLREKYRDSFEEKFGVKLGFMGMFMKASSIALQEMPIVNASIDGDDIVYHGHQDIGVAVSSERGLVVPVVRNVSELSISEIEIAIRDYSIKAREGKLGMEDITGGTFTISNGGVFGSLLSTPILNPPQSAILGMHKIQDRPMVVDGKIEIRPMMYLALTYDHRLLDGKDAVSFLVKIKESLEAPESMILGV